MVEGAKESTNTTEPEVSEMPTVETNNQFNDEFTSKALPAVGVAVIGALFLGNNHDLNIKKGILLWAASLAVYNRDELTEDVKQGMSVGGSGVNKFEAVLANVLNKGTPYSGPETSSSAEDTADKSCDKPETEMEIALA